DQYDTVFEAYVGEITFSTNALGTCELPTDYTFEPADNGVRDFPASVMFEDPGTYNVTVEDTSDSTLKGSQEDIEIEPLVATSIDVSGPPSTMSTDSFSVTVTVLDQYGNVHDEYLGTVVFTTSDGSGNEVLPVPYEFTALDAGIRTFSDELILEEVGAQTVTVEDNLDSSVTGTLDIDVTPFVTSTLTYRIYDIFEEPWGEWWGPRPIGLWDTDRLLTSDAGEVTSLYAVWGKPKGSTDDQGMIYAPYRWNVTGTELPNIDAHNPTMMPKMGSYVAGAEASMDIYFQYGYQEWWDNYWIPEWGTHPDWGDWDGLFENYDDGWYVYTVYDIDMNHEAAEEWLGMDASDDPDDWWTTNEGSYVDAWDVWILDQGNVEYDIFCAYDYAYTTMSTTMMRLTGDLSDVQMEIAHVSWGYEMLMTRWLNHTGLSEHQVYMEDFDMELDLRESDADVMMDAVCQWSLHCVKQDAAAPGDNALCAWAWEPLGADYMYGGEDHVSTYDPYDPLMGDVMYHSWNCGDPNYDTEIGYEGTPWAFSLPSYAKLIVELPSGSDLPGYYAEPIPEDAMKLAWETDSDLTIYDDLRYYGEMDFGYIDLSGCSDFSFEVIEGVNTLTIDGGYDFTNPHPDDSSLLYHGAPWLEFNVNPVLPKLAASSVAPEGASGVGIVTPEEQISASVSVSATGEIVSLAGMMCAVLLTIAALAAGAGRRREEL
ncbi:MAG: hypothetical protein WBC49_05260, partial [Thermoplasmata archaeon]